MSEEEKLAELFRAYREACPDPEPSADFTPGVWAKIEARRRSVSLLRRWTAAFVATATALSLLMAVHAMRQTDPGAHIISYVDTLAADEPFETFAFGDLAYLDSSNNLR